MQAPTGFEPSNGSVAWRPAAGVNNSSPGLVVFLLAMILTGLGNITAKEGYSRK